MIRDLNTKKTMKNAYRITKNRYETALRVRIPGGCVDSESLMIVSKIANEYGNGQIHMTTRQGFEILGIKMEDMEKVNKLVQSIIEKMEINQEEKDKGYSAAGTRNIASCIGNKVCPKAQYNTTEFAKKIEKAVFPNDLHVKIALTGCPNDCIKARTHDFGIIGMTLPHYERDRCVSCGACVKKCKQLSTGALHAENYRVIRDHSKCIGCGECVLNCPTNAWSRDPKKYYRLAIMGRSGKKNPRLAEDFLIWADEENIIKIILNTYKYVEKYIDKSLPKEHIGYIVDRTGFMEFKKWALEGVEFDDITIVKDNVYWSGIKY
ncbi:sulfite reductase subunit C [Romboutsia sp. 1001216sp1]|uniref:sulfite reductase subunit C n=1 Tax=Romboutsia sp. 1001216sp1 TaxID=2986997 RepID=UPI00232CCAA2|nr:sulfite reductase subunit C [Romboutsia sp. 1001216sp1]MDB8803530.1 sulfite reductase subunit C [Romboutsia sp. 1001216sp1]MDB8808470.1 sulfite reductase subunit C [Romboutsia sp. 1001216sp1]MDB8809178.1 sulfite reductase subunit C [Romboutsia sp. 1001216sp1]MDB8814926.1 sulfite reductase subunit C [Romboutsia sp. 1001216sp1]MDB8819659.1 sulfite reductase subunit C [Romboutsia sp. 1001216sp1]